ncbi:hypothetical protein [uncultured Phascolarctobacterium sp.]|uniref:hypothetical protein n=1 Tax=uncultured Phascolarctobacterium sp. TaxID=512296 RepID=UPI0025FFA4C4|nr:hypothetical protein [uncultured Phascolarctobacterium sp.]
MTDIKVCTYECPNCGAPISITDKICGHCFSSVYLQMIKDSNNLSKTDIAKHIAVYKKNIEKGLACDVDTLISLGICHYKNGMYSLSLKSFEQAIDADPENVSGYYYAALSVLNGKRPYMQTLSKIKKVVGLLEAAMNIQTEGRIYYFLYLVQVDFFDKKHLRTNYNSAELKKLAMENLVTEEEINELKENLCIK